MKLTKLLGTLALAAAFALPSQAQTPAGREHRAIWLSPYLSSSWPSSDLSTVGAVSSQTTILRNRLQKFKAQNINVIYFHVRSNCDALYKSSYEPWSAKVAGTRGGTPAGDALQIIIDEAHAVGIEVYAWVNPYRYSNNTSYGSNPIEYENAHPDWLLKNFKQTVLNPGKEEVKQRIVDVISEIVTNYDVDGVLYDDYFYPQGGTPEGAGSPDYDLWKASGTSLSQGDWRRANVNEMVERVYKAIKKIKPYLPFGISPAGVASPQGVVTDVYGLPPVSGDWQYNQIYSDPLAWYKAGTVDFMSPQIYWPNRYRELSSWWANAGQKFGRHLYPSVDITSITKGQTVEYMDEALYTREVNGRDLSGFVFFHYADYVNYSENVFGKLQNFGVNFAQGVFTEKALTPLRPWDNQRNPRMTSNVRREGTKLVWDAVEGMRYTVYAVPAGTESAFGGQREFLDGISYTNSYEIPKDKTSGYSFAVAVYDRFGNEYAPLFEGHSVKTLPAPQLTYPADGAEPGFMFDFAWSSEGTRFVFDLATDQAFENTLASFEVMGKKTVPVNDLPPLETGKTYWWRVRLSSPDAQEALSEARSFVASEIAFISPVHQSAGHPYDNLEVVWQKAPEGTEYTFELSERENMTAPVFKTVVQDVDRVVIPERTLSSGKTYYMTVKAVNGNATSTSKVHSFSTVEKTDYTTPELVNPASDGQTMHSNWGIEVAPYSGFSALEVYISASNSFPSRQTKKYSITDFSTETSPLGDATILSKKLVDGTTYYTRVRGAYSTSGGTKYTDYVTRSFVYSATAGVGSVEADGQAAAWIEDNGIVHFAAGTIRVEVYTLAGALVSAIEPASGATEAQLGELASGAYVVRISGAAPATLKFVK